MVRLAVAFPLGEYSADTSVSTWTIPSKPYSRLTTSSQEGIITLIIGFLSWGLMPPGPTQTKNWFRGKNGWFNDHEEKILVNRLLRDDPSKGDMNNREGVGLKLLWKAIQDWEMWPLYIIGLLACEWT